MDGSDWGPISSSPAVANGVVYVGSEDSTLYAFDAATGAQLWSAATGGQIYHGSPSVSDGVVYVGSTDDNLYAFAPGGKDNATYKDTLSPNQIGNR